MEPLDILPVLQALAVHEVEYVLVGGMAMNFHGLLRTTEDVDLFVRPDAENVERLKRALHEVYDDESIDEISADDLAGDYPTVRPLDREDAARLSHAFGLEDER